MAEPNEQLAFAFGARPPHQSVVLEAGAGTGKTTEIVRRVLCLLLDEPELDPAALVLMTFTEKAAAEIADRIRLGLTSLQASFASGRSGWFDAQGRELFAVPPARRQEWAEACERQMQRLDRVHSQTIHSFCQNLLRLHPIEAGIDPGFVIIEGFERTRLYADGYARWVESETADQAPVEQHQQWSRVYEHFGSLQKLRTAIFDLLPKRDLVADRRYSLGDPAAVVAMIRQAAVDLRAINRREIEQIEQEPARQFALHLLERPVPAAASVHDLLAWLEPVEIQLQQIDLRRGKRTISAILRRLHQKSEWGRTLADLLREHQAAVDLRELAIRFFEFLDAEKRSLGVLDFDDLLFATRRLLDDPAALDRIRDRYRYLFVDEFQDTDRVQAEIVERLSTLETGELVPGKTVLVGDPKQSIYSFRRADPEMYAATVERFLRAGAEQQYLDRQFRSEPRLVEDLNAFFGAVFGEIGEGSPPESQNRFVFQPRYKRLEAARAASTSGQRPFRFLHAPRGSAADDDIAQAHAIASWIHQQPTDPRGYRRFAILLRRMTVGQQYGATLEAHGIPVAAPPGDSLLDHPVAVDLLSVLRVIAFPFDTGARFSAVRSPWFALTDDEIVRHQLHIAHEEPCAFDQVTQALARYRRLASTLTVTRLIELLVDETGIDVAYAMLRDASDCSRVLDRLRVIASDYDRRRGGSIREFVEEIGHRRDGGGDLEAATVETDADAVRIMTVHAAKGLEFDTVILPDLSPGAAQDALKFSIVEQTRSLVFSGSLSSLSGRFTSDEGVPPLRDVVRQREAAEEKRLLYVAMTRARSEVVFVCHEKLVKRGFWTTIQDTLGLDPDLTPFWSEAADGPVEKPLPADRPLLVATFEVPRPRDAPVARPPRLQNETLEQELRKPALDAQEPLVVERLAPPERLAPGRLARLRAGQRQRGAGLLLHRALELWDGDRPALDSLVRRLAAETGASEEDVELVRRRLRRLLESRILHDLEAMETVAKELPIHTIDTSGKLVEGRIDRLFRRNGRLVVLDYKSGRADVERLEQDRLQVRHYCAAIRRITGQACDGLLWYIDLEGDELVPVETENSS